MFPMKLEVTITEVKQLQALAALLGGAPAELPAKVEKKAEVQKAEPEVQKTEPEAPKAEAPGGKTLDEAKALTMKVVAAKGRDAAVALLEKYGVKVAAKLAAEQIEGFCADAEEALK